MPKSVHTELGFPAVLPRDQSEDIISRRWLIYQRLMTVSTLVFMSNFERIEGNICHGEYSFIECFQLSAAVQSMKDEITNPEVLNVPACFTPPKFPHLTASRKILKVQSIKNLMNNCGVAQDGLAKLIRPLQHN